MPQAYSLSQASPASSLGEGAFARRKEFVSCGEYNTICQFTAFYTHTYNSYRMNKALYTAVPPVNGNNP